MEWKKAHPGIRYREHPERKHGILPDRYYTLYYKLAGKSKNEALGWASEGWTLEKAIDTLNDLKRNRRKGTGPRTLKEQRQEQDLEQKRRQADGLTVSEFWEEDYLSVLKARVKASSADREIREFNMRSKPTIGDKPLKEVSEIDVERIIDKMRADGLTPRTQEYLRGTLFRLWKHGARRKLVKAGDNPAAGIRVPQGNNGRLRVLTSSELKEILDRLAGLNAQDYKLTLFCALTGCRFSEAARLTWEHVDLVRRVALFPETKNRDSREVYLADPIIEALGAPGSTGTRVFVAAQGKPYREPPKAFKTVVDHLKLNEERGKRDRVVFHSLRHTAATVAARRGTPIKDLQIMFGWKTPSMVFRYAKGDEAIQRQASDGIAQALLGEPAKVLPLRRKERAS